LVDSKNSIYFIVAGTNADFLKWTTKIYKAISLFSERGGDSHPTSNLSLMGFEAAGTCDTSTMDASGGLVSASSERDEFGEARNLGKSLSRVVKVVKEKGRIGERSKERKAMSSSHSVSSGEENFNDELLGAPAHSFNPNDPPLSERVSRGGHFRSRVAGTGLGLAKGLGTASVATKSKLGTALQNAKQKGKSVAERRRQQASTHLQEDISMENAADATQASPPDNTAFDPEHVSDQIHADQDISYPMEIDGEMVDQNDKDEEYLAHRAPTNADESTVDNNTPIQESVAATEMNVDRGGSMRSRLGGVGRFTKKGIGSAGMATKSRLGSALQAAKQKSKEVVEKRHQRTMHSAHVVSCDEMQAKLSWPCELCTFDNPPSCKTCQMCGSARNEETRMQENQPIPRVITEHSEMSHDMMKTVFDEKDKEITIFDQENLGEEQSSRVEAGISHPQSLDGKIRSRASMKQRIGEVVGIVKKNANRGDSLKNVEQTPIGAPDSLILRGVWVKGPLSIPTHPFEGAALGSSNEVDLKKIQGHWRVFVEAQLSEISKYIGRSSEISSEVDNAKHTLDNKSEATEYSDIEHDNELVYAPEEVNTIQSYTAEHVESLENKIEVTFRIRVFCLDVNQPETCAEIFKTLPDILALHTALSESLAGVPPHALLTGNSSENTDCVKSPYLAETLLLTTLDVVRVTGQLLGGALRASINDPKLLSNDEFLKYNCEFLSDCV
jgi:hypothetical protein